MSFLQNLEAEAAAFVKSAKAEIVSLAAKEEAAFKPLVAATENDIVTVGGPLVLTALGTVATSILTGGVNLAPVVSALVVGLGNAGKAIAVEDAQAGVQIIANQIRSAAAAAQPAA